MSVWNWIQRFGSLQIYKRKRVSSFIIDETIIQIDNQHFWLWICIEPVHSYLLEICISGEINILVAEYKEVETLFIFFNREQSNGTSQSVFQR